MGVVAVEKTVVFEVLPMKGAGVDEIHEFLDGSNWVFTPNTTVSMMVGVMHRKGTIPASAGRRFLYEENQYLVKKDGVLMTPVPFGWLRDNGILIDV